MVLQHCANCDKCVNEYIFLLKTGQSLKIPFLPEPQGSCSADRKLLQMLCQRFTQGRARPEEEAFN